MENIDRLIKHVENAKKNKSRISNSGKCTRTEGSRNNIKSLYIIRQ